MIRRLFLLQYLLSGACLMALECAWIRSLGRDFGNTLLSANAAICLLLGWAGLGNLAGGRLSARVASPARLFALAELLAGAGALAGLALYPLAQRLAGGVLPGWAGLAACGSVLVGPAAFCGGISFPALGAWAVHRLDERIACGAAFHAANLAGGCLGVVAGGWLLPQWLGHGASYVAIAGLQAGAAGMVLAVAWRRDGSRPGNAGAEARMATEAILDRHLPGLLLVANGAVMMSFQLLAMIALLQLCEPTSHLVNAVIFGNLAGLALGTVLAPWLRRQAGDARRLLVVLLPAVGLVLMLFPLVLRGLPPFHAEAGARSVGGYLLRLFGMSTLAVLLPAAGIGAAFPPLWELFARESPRHGAAMGRILAWHKAGTVLGILVLTGLASRWLGIPGTIVLLGLLLTCLSTALARNRRQVLVLGVATALAIAVILLTRLSPPEPGDRLLEARTGPWGIATVIEDREGSRHIVLNRNYQLNGTGWSMPAQRHQGWLPPLFAARHRRVMVIGMASGISADAVLDFPVDELTAVEIDPQVRALAERHFAPWNQRLFVHPKARIVVGDGRHVLRRSPASWDLIVCDLLHPWHAGVEGIYSRDFFAEAGQRLGGEGVLCVWLAMHQLDAPAFGILVRNFLAEFPHAIAIRGNLDPRQPIVALLGSRAKFALDTATLRHRLAAMMPTPAREQSAFLASPAHLRLAVLGDLHGAAVDFAGYPLSDDDRPAFAFRSPEIFIRRKVLRGLPLLEHLGNRFHDRGLPSVAIPPGEEEGLRRAIIAGNNHFAAAVMAVPLSDGRDAESRHRRLLHYLQRAQSLAPEAAVPPALLGR